MEGITNVRAWPEAGVQGASVTYMLGSPMEEFTWRCEDSWDVKISRLELTHRTMVPPCGSD